MQNLRRLMFPILLAVALVGFSVAEAAPQRAAPQASATSFHFVFSADSRDNYTVLPAFSHKMVTLSPIFGVFGGDLCGSFDTTCINKTWKPALDGNNHDGMLARTFVLRGNHDNGSLSTWQGLWDFASMATRLGATHFTAQTSDATYSFDYGNSHFAVLDNPGGGPSSLTSSQISWLDSDLTAAEKRGVAHEFLFTHGPMYGVTSQHGSDYPSSAMKAVLNKHRISAGFHGHEHITQYTHVTPSVETGINSYQEFTMGRAGAPAYSVVKYTNWHSDTNAFADIAVNGSRFTVTVYSQAGSAIFTKTFTDGSPGPTPTPAPSSGTVSYISAAAYDGQVVESTKTSSMGGSIYSTDTTFRIGNDDTGREYRGVVSFDTSGLPDNAVISWATLKIRQAGGAGPNPFGTMGNIVGGIKTGAFSDNMALQSSDFQAAASVGPILTVPNNPSSGWYSGALTSGAFAYINKKGNTQLRLRFSTVPNNRKAADYLSFYSGNSTTAAYRPQLIIKYTVP